MPDSECCLGGLAANGGPSWLFDKVKGRLGMAPEARMRPQWATAEGPLGNFCLGLLSMLSSELVLAIDEPSGKFSSNKGPKLEDL